MRRPILLRTCLISAYLLVLSQTAQAALFGDDEARKKIIDLQQQVQAENQTTQATLSEIKKNQQTLDQRLAAIEAVVKGQGLLDLLSQIDRLNQDLNRVKGQLELATHSIETTQQHQQDLYADVDGRLRKVEGSAVAVAAPSATVSTDNTAVAVSPSASAAAPAISPEAKDYETAQALSRAGNYKEAYDAYEKFLQTYPGSALAPAAQYSLGYAQFALKNYKAAMTTQQKLIKQYPDNAKVPDALFSIANSQIQLSDIEGAKKTLHSLIYQYPNSEVAPNARKRLALLDSIKSK